MPEHDHRTRHVEERAVHGRQVLVPDHEAAVVPQPREEPFDLPAPAVATQRTTVLGGGLHAIPAVGADELDPSLRQAGAQRIAVVAAIGDQARGLLARPAAAGARDGNRVERLVDERDFRRGGRGQGASQRKTRAVCHHHPLRAFPPLGRADGEPPFFAGAKLPSMNASLQCNRWRPSSSARNARQSLSQVPSSSQRRRRRQQVAGLGYAVGSAFQWAPVRSTQRIPSKQARSPAQGRPRPSWRRGKAGKWGAIFAHWASVTNGPKAIAAPSSGAMRLLQSLTEPA